MKTKIIVAAFLLVLGTSANAQKNIELKDLPKVSQDFLQQYFSNTTIDVVKKDAEHGEKGYEVKLKDGTEVEFWKDGSYREVDGHDKPIPTAFLPQWLNDYVTQHHPYEKVTHIDYGHKDVDVDLTNNIDLEFTKDGKVLKDKKDKD